MDLGKPGRLGSEVPCCAARVVLCHALVTVPTVVSRKCAVCGGQRGVGQRRRYEGTWRVRISETKGRVGVVCACTGPASGLDWGVGTYIYFINTSKASVPPGALYMRLSSGDMSDCRIDWRISITVARCTSYWIVKPRSAQFSNGVCLCACASGLRGEARALGVPYPK